MGGSWRCSEFIACGYIDSFASIAFIASVLLFLSLTLMTNEKNNVSPFFLGQADVH